MFEPAFCPWRECGFHAAAPRGFCVPHGAYKPKCRTHPVPRFRCTGCGRTFSRQTFRCDYRMRKPHLVADLARHLVSGGSLRQAARFTVSRRTIARTLIRLGTHASHYHASALSRFVRAVEPPRFQFDELETYEEDRIFKPLTVGTLLQEDTRFLVGLAVGTLRSHCDKSEASKLRRAAFEERHGRRPNESRKVIRELLAPLAARPDDGGPRRLLFTTDEKRSYPFCLREAFGSVKLAHVQVSSRIPRDGRNPLAPINQLDVMTRHHNARLQRESIAASKKAEKLRHQLAIFMAWWNYCRPRTNRDRVPPACYAGILPRRARAAEVFGWRHDFGPGRLPLLEAA